MFEKMNISRIIFDHISTLKDYGSGKYKLGDIIIYIGLPIIVSILLIYFNFILNSNMVGILITAMAIFAGLFFNLLVLVYDVTLKSNKTKEDPNGIKSSLLRETYANISFSIFISLIMLILLISFYLFDENRGYVMCISFLVYLLFSVFILTTFMVLKRIHILLSKEFNA